MSLTSLENIVNALNNNEVKSKLRLAEFFLSQYDEFNFNRYKNKFFEEVNNDKNFENFSSFKSYQIKCIEELDPEELKFLVLLTHRIVNKKIKSVDEAEYNSTDFLCCLFNHKKELIVLNKKTF